MVEHCEKHLEFLQNALSCRVVLYQTEFHFRDRFVGGNLVNTLLAGFGKKTV